MILESGYTKSPVYESVESVVTIPYDMLYIDTEKHAIFKDSMVVAKGK